MNSPIFDIDNWREIGTTLARNKTRTFLTAFGIFWGTAILAMLLGGSTGLEGMMRRNFNDFATNVAFLSSNRTTISYKGFNKGTRWQMNYADVEAMRRLLPYLDASTAISFSHSTIAYGSKTASANVSAVEGGYSKILIPTMYEGRFINQNDVAKTAKVAVLGKNIAAELFGSESPLGKYVAVGSIFYQVIGVAGQTSEVNIGGRLDDSVVLPYTTWCRATGSGTEIGAFMFTAKQGHSPTDMLPQIERILRINHPIHPDDHDAYWFNDVSKDFKMVDNLFLGIQFIAFFVGIGTLLAGIIGVGNIMWIIVKERTQEFGIRRAIGAKPRDVIMQVLSEGLILTIIAGIAGLCFATLVLTIADKVTTDPVLGSAGFGITFADAIGIVVIFTLLGALAGMIPAYKAMKIKPIEALNAK